MASTISLFCNDKTDYSRSDLNLAEDFQCIKNLKFISLKLEKKIKKKVLRHSSLRMTWAEALFVPEPIGGCLRDMEINFINPLVGFGVFAQKIIPRYTFVGEYVGLVRRRKLSFISDSDYVFGYNIRSKSTNWVVDAEKMGNITRFFNHSYDPNLICSSWISDGVSHVGFFAKRKIMMHEQLTFDYGPCFWKKRMYPQTL